MTLIKSRYQTQLKPRIQNNEPEKQTKIFITPQIYKHTNINFYQEIVL